MVGKVVKPTSTVKPETPIEIGLDPLVTLVNLPNENLPRLSPEKIDEKPILLMLHTREPLTPLLVIAFI